MGTEEQWAQRNSGHRGTVRNEEQLGNRGTIGTEEQWAQRNVRHRGTQRNSREQRNVRHRGTVSTDEQ